MTSMASDSPGTYLRTGARGVTGLLGEFKTFLLRGNVVDLAVGVVIGVAFSGVVTAMVKDLFTPLIAAIGAQPDFGGLFFTINHSRFRYGDFIDALLAFAIIAAVVFFFVVLPMNRLVALSRRFEHHPAPTTRKCTECLSEIPKEARRCAYCTSPQVPEEATAQRS
jgi:large conductance mechanosensitive channel